MHAALRRVVVWTAPLRVCPPTSAAQPDTQALHATDVMVMIAATMMMSMMMMMTMTACSSCRRLCEGGVHISHLCVAARV